MTKLRKTMNQKWAEEAREALPAKITMLAESFNELGERWAAVAKSQGSPGALARLDKAALLGLAGMVKDDAYLLQATMEKALRPDDPEPTKS